MFSIVITERGGAQRTLGFDESEISIGRIEDNDIVLPKNNVSKRHARMVLKDGRYILIDLKSTNGTYVNGRKISAPMVVSPSDKIYVGDFILSLSETPARRIAPRRAESGKVDSMRPPPPEPVDEPGLGAPGGGFERKSAIRPSQKPPAGGSASPPRNPRETVSGKPPQHSGPPPQHSGPPPQPSGPPQHTAPRPPRLPDLSSEAPPAEGANTVAPPRGPFDSQEPHTSERKIERKIERPTPPRRPSMPPRVEDPESGAGPATSPAVLAPSVRLQGALHTLMERLAKHMDVAQPQERAFPSEHQSTLEKLIDELAEDGVIGPDLDRRFLTEAAISEAVGLGPLDRLLNNRSVREVVVDGPSRILADLGGGLSAVSSFFSSRDAVGIVATRLLARADIQMQDTPVQEAQLPDGSHVQLLLPPLSPHGPLISVRCPPQTPSSADGLVTEGVLSTPMLSLLRAAMKQQINLLVLGPMSAGVSSLLSALASLSQGHERVVALQQAPSLSIDHPQLLPLTRGGTDEDFRLLLGRIARLRPDRLVIDDLDGTEALAAVMHAAASRGVLVGMHAPNPTAALQQLELFSQLTLGGGAQAPLAGTIAQAFGIIVHVELDRDGSRRVKHIEEVLRGEGEKLELRTLFRHDGGFHATEHRAGFLDA